MNRTMAFVAALTALLASSAAAAPDEPDRVRYYGRWDLREAGRAVTVNSGSHVVARFEGTAIEATFDLSANQDPVPTIAWRIDEGEWQEAEVAATVKLAEGLPAGPHALTLMARGLDEHQSRWTPPLVASLTFLGLRVTGGGLLDPPAEPKLKLEFLGDSITEGVLVHGDRPGKTTWPWKTDGRLAYAAQAALKLGAQWRQVGFGAQGLTRGGSGGVPPAPETFNSLYHGCPRDDDWRPDAVVINQGTNDGGAPADVFRPAYKGYLEVIRTAYPDAKIVCLRPFNGAQADPIRAEVEARHAAGDRNVYYVDTAGWLDEDDYTDGVHPNVDGGATAAERLAEALGKILH